MFGPIVIHTNINILKQQIILFCLCAQASGPAVTLKWDISNQLHSALWWTKKLKTFSQGRETLETSDRDTCEGPLTKKSNVFYMLNVKLHEQIN